MLYDLTVIIPTFNEEENIEKMIVTVDTICRAHKITEEILVVDDGSSDKTSKIAKDLGVIIYSNKKNLGLIKTFKIEIEKCLEVMFIVGFPLIIVIRSFVRSPE